MDYTEIFEEYRGTVYRLALARMKNKYDAQDVCSEVFLRLIKAKPTFESGEHTKAWLIRVTLNCCNSMWNSLWFKRRVSEAENIGVVDLPEDYSQLLAAVHALRKKYRVVIHLFYYEDMSVKDIAKVLKIKEQTVTSQLCRARKMLKECLNYEEIQ